MKKLIVNLFALLVIVMGGFYLTISANAASNSVIQSGPTCLDMGCIGGETKCYKTPEGGMCYTGGDEDPQEN